MAIIEFNGGSGRNLSLKMATSTTITKDTALVQDANGLLVAVGTTTTSPKFIAQETKTSTSDTPFILVKRCNPAQLYIVDCTNAVNQNQCGNQCDFTDAGTLNNASSDGTYKAMEIISLYGAAADKKVIAAPVYRGA